ncbi:hypothetical protein N826_14625, partial [Skermanella aerolata KACC 11604]|uniref:MASE1 domain-containing protein n=2 Tax=Skermanella aerolata TaxID=393310 RepID=UPI0005C96E66
MSGSYRVPPAARAGSGARPTSGWQLLLIGALVFAGAWAGIMITHEADRVAPIWITNAVLLAVLLRSSAHRWPLVLAVGCIANALANITTGDAAVTALGLSACNTLEIVTAALLLARPAGSPLDLRRSAVLVRFVACAGGAAPALSATAAAGFLALTAGADPAAVWQTWFLADALGMLVVAPLLLMLRTRELAGLFRPPLRHETAALLAGLTAVVGLVFAQSSLPILFVVLPLLVLTAFRLGFAGAAVATLLTAVISIGLTIEGYGPAMLADTSVVGRVLLLQGFLAVAVLTSLPVASILAQQRRTEAALGISETLYRTLVLSSREVVF